MIDFISRKILQFIQYNGRASLKTLAAEIGLSLPATSERIKRLEESGVIEGYRAMVPADKVGYSVTAVIGITTSRDFKAKLIDTLEKTPEVLECLHVTGQDSYLIRVVVKDLLALEAFAGSINQYGETRTSVVMSQPIALRPVTVPVQEIES